MSASTALFLAVVGIYGVMTQAVGQRRQEFGVRMALGATTRNIIMLVVGGGAWLAVAGLTAGVILAVATTRLLGTLLYQVRPIDPLTFAGVAGLLFAVGVLASYVPARRATKVDPAQALRDA